MWSAAARDAAREAARQAACTIAAKLLDDANALAKDNRIVRAIRAAERSAELCDEKKDAARKVLESLRGRHTRPLEVSGHAGLLARVDAAGALKADARRRAMESALVGLERKVGHRVTPTVGIGAWVTSAAWFDGGRSLMVSHGRGMSIFRSSDWREVTRRPVAPSRFLAATRDYREAHLRYTRHNLVAESARFELAKAQLAKARGIKPSGFAIASFVAQHRRYAAKAKEAKAQATAKQTLARKFAARPAAVTSSAAPKAQ